VAKTMERRSILADQQLQSFCRGVIVLLTDQNPHCIWNKERCKKFCLCYKYS